MECWTAAPAGEDRHRRLEDAPASAQLVPGRGLKASTDPQAQHRALGSGLPEKLVPQPTVTSCRLDFPRPGQDPRESWKLGGEGQDVGHTPAIPGRDRVGVELRDLGQPGLYSETLSQRKIN